MRITHNIAALNTYRQLTGVTNATSKSLEKLSSGYRINRAGDDAAGLAISEKMRGQIRGLDQAMRNAQDGISLIQTAEGALNETHSILQRMRELAVQAANDTNTNDDRIEIQKEIDQLLTEIDRIGNDTEFNTKKLVNGSQAQRAELTPGATNVLGARAVSAMDPGVYTITTANVSEIAANLNDTGTGIDAAAITAFGANVNIGDSFKIIVTNYDGGADTADIVLQDAGGNEIASLDAADLTAAIAIGADDGLTIGANVITGDGEVTLDFAIEADYSIAKGGVEIQSIIDEVTTSGRVLVGGFELTVDNTLAAAADGSIEVEGEALRLQIGANENQSLRLSIGNMKAAALGINGISVTSYENAKAAITTVDMAISIVSSERAKLGAVQNRLEHTINNLGTASENLTAAESRIRDVDMAREMMEFTKNNIISQAATAMLAQANMQPQQVLQLLQ